MHLKGDLSGPHLGIDIGLDRGVISQLQIAPGAEGGQILYHTRKSVPSVNERSIYVIHEMNSLTT